MFTSKVLKVKKVYVLFPPNTSPETPRQPSPCHTFT